MANWANIQVVKSNGKSAIVAVTSSRSDGYPGCHYTVHRMRDGSVVRYGHSAGWDGLGAGSALSAMKNGKASARRYLKSKEAEADE